MGAANGNNHKFCGLALEKDKGYAWVVLAASYLPQMCSIGFAYSVAVILNSWNEEYAGKHSKAMISSVGSLNCAALFCSGVLASYLIEKLGHRLTVVIGGLLCVTGYVISFFAPNIWILLIGYGLFTGIGFGLMYMGSITIVSLWFDRYRAIACGFAASGNGIGTFINALLLLWMLDKSGWRATMLYQAAIVAQCCVVAMLFRPPPSSIEAGKKEEAAPLNDTKPQAKKEGFFCVAVQLFKTTRFNVFFLNNLTWPLGVIVFYAFCFKLALEVGNFSPSQAGWAVSGIGLIDAFCRIIAGGLSSSFNISPSIFYFIGQFGFGAVICITPFLNAFVSPYVASGLFGAFFGCQLGTLVSTTAELFNPEQISTVFGILIVANGLGNGVGPIVAESLLEAFDNSYRLVYLVFGLIVLAGLTLTIPIMVNHWRSLRKTPQKPNSPAKVADDSAFAILETDGRNEEL